VTAVDWTALSSAAGRRAHGVDAVGEQDRPSGLMPSAQAEDDRVAQCGVASLGQRPHAFEQRLGVLAVEVLHALALVEEDDDDLLCVGKAGEEAHGYLLRAA
jgi:hypothetical protein